MLAVDSCELGMLLVWCCVSGLGALVRRRIVGALCESGLTCVCRLCVLRDVHVLNSSLVFVRLVVFASGVLRLCVLFHLELSLCTNLWCLDWNEFVGLVDSY